MAPGGGLVGPPGAAGADERLVRAGRPALAGYGKEPLWLYPLFLLFGAAAGGWWFYSWAAGAGALWHARALAFLAIVWLFAALLVALPLAWPLRPRRSSYALTMQRLLIRKPAMLVLWPRVRRLGPAESQGVRLRCTWAWLPGRTGDIACGSGLSDLMERVPHAEEVAALIRQTLCPPEGRPPDGHQQGAAPAPAAGRPRG
jgi:hypothetical protein